MIKDIFLAFLRLGLIAFGGPTAHMGYFHGEFVAKRKWITQADYADLIALCQFLPGPSSSQLGLALGWIRGKKRGALAAWAGFTLPSALIMTALAMGLSAFGPALPMGLLAGLKVAAVAVVAKALLTMAVSLCPDWPRRVLALLCAALMILSGLWPVLGGQALLWQCLVIGLGLVLGLTLYKSEAMQGRTPNGFVRRPGRGWPYLAVFFGLLIALPVAAQIFPDPSVRLADIFYRTGSMVFGGGHVVLPVLEAQTAAPGLLSADDFMAGYGAAQAMPGPLFSFAAFLGGAIDGPWGALIALVAIYVPSFLLVFGVMPYWQKLSAIGPVRAGLMGVNAAVVGLLLAAFWDPVITSGVTGWKEGLLALGVFAGLMRFKLAPFAAVLGCAALGWAIL